HGFLNALIYWLDVFLRHRPADDVVYELVALARLVQIEFQLCVSVLAASTGLPDVLAFGFRVLANRLAVGYLRFADVGLNLVLAHHAVDDDFQMQLTHTADDGLTAIGISVNLEG